MMKSISLSLLASAAVTASAIAGTPVRDGKAGPVAPPAPPECAEGISYSNFETDWVHSWGRNDNQNADGVNAEVSVALTDNLYFHTAGLWASGSEVDIWGANVGLGGHIPLAHNIDFVTEAGGAFSGADHASSNNGFYVQPHLRAKFGCVELRAGATFYDLKESDDWEGFASLYYQFAPHTDLAVRGIFSEYSSTLQLGLRYKF